ncbi:transposase, MuDR, MULE transposase domain protein [Tanacetum coccineum]
MACSVSHTDDEIQALVQKLIDKDMVRQKAFLDLALQFDNACTAKDDLRKAYEKCNDISQESRALIDTFLKEGSDKDYELNFSMYGKATKIEKQMNAKLVWLWEKYNYSSQTHMGGSSSQTHEIGDVYLTEKELHQLHLDEEALRETIEEEAKAEKEQEEKIRQKQADDELFMLEFGVKYDSEYDIIPGPVGIVQAAKPLKQMDILLCLDDAVMSTQDYMKKVKDADFKSGSWVSATDYVNANGGTSCFPNVTSDLTVTMKDLSSTIPGTIHHKVFGEGGYEKDITVEAALILANILVFSPKPSMHYLNITMRNVVKVLEVAVVNALP